MHLYKYFTPEGILRFLRTCMVRFTQPVVFNDPFEMQPFLKGFAAESELDSQFKSEFGNSLDPQIDQMLSQLPREQTNVTRETIRQLVLDQAPEALTAFKDLARTFTPFVGGEIYKRINENLGVLCLTEKPTNLLMWAHYADQHQGAVVEFDTSHAFFNRRRGPQDDFRHLRKVFYTEQRPHLLLNNSDALRFFYFKSPEWEYEQEWRLIVPLADCESRLDQGSNPPVCLFEVPPECIRSVCLGIRMSQDRKLELTTELRGTEVFRNVRVEQIDMDAQQFELHRREISSTALNSWLTKTGN